MKLKCPLVVRPDRIRKTCKELGLTPLASSQELKSTIPYPRIIIDKRHKLIYCFVPKAGSTTWKTILKNATGHPRAPLVRPHDYDKLHKVLNLPRLDTLPAEEGYRLLKDPDYIRFMIVRHPIGRLLSAYQEKVIDMDWLHKQGYIEGKWRSEKQRNKLIAKLLKQGKTDISKALGDMPFKEFVEYLVKEKGQDKRKRDDQHWESQIDNCRPCKVNYDYILHTETMQRDAPYILSQLPEQYRTLTKMNPGSTHSDRDKWKQFRDLDKHLKDKLYTYYEHDFKLLGYSWAKNSSKAKDMEPGMC